MVNVVWKFVLEWYQERPTIRKNPHLKISEQFDKDEAWIELGDTREDRLLALAIGDEIDVREMHVSNEYPLHGEWGDVLLVLEIVSAEDVKDHPHPWPTWNHKVLIRNLLVRRKQRTS